jgi:hypothetical protein
MHKAIGLGTMDTKVNKGYNFSGTIDTNRGNRINRYLYYSVITIV